MLDAKQKSSYPIGMNKLPLQIRITILNMLVEGSSMRSISRITGVSINTVTKLLENAGKACAAFHDTTVVNVSAIDEALARAAALDRDAAAAPIDVVGALRRGVVSIQVELPVRLKHLCVRGLEP